MGFILSLCLRLLKVILWLGPLPRSFNSLGILDTSLNIPDVSYRLSGFQCPKPVPSAVFPISSCSCGVLVVLLESPLISSFLCLALVTEKVGTTVWCQLLPKDVGWGTVQPLQSAGTEWTLKTWEVWWPELTQLTEVYEAPGSISLLMPTPPHKQSLDQESSWE